MEATNCLNNLVNHLDVGQDVAHHQNLELRKPQVLQIRIGEQLGLELARLDDLCEVLVRADPEKQKSAPKLLHAVVR